MFLLVVVFLFIRAFSELALPQYMSGIVDYGIARQGIDSPVPEVMSADLFVDIIDNIENEEHYIWLWLHYQLMYNQDINDVSPSAQSRLTGRFSELGNEIFVLDVPKSDISQETTDAIAMAIAYTQLDTDLILTQSMANQAAMDIIAAEYEKLGVDMSSFQMNYIFTTGGLMLLITFVSIIAAISQGFISARIATGIARKLREDIFKKVTSFTNTEYNNFSTATFITRSTNDVTQVQQLLAMGIRIIIYSPIMAAGGVIMVVGTNMSMAWIIGMAIGLIITFVAIFYAIAAPRFRIIQKFIDKVNLVTREGLTGIMVIRAFSTQKHEESRFDDVNTSLRNNQLFLHRLAAFQNPVINMVFQLTTILIVWVGANSVQAGNLQVGHMMAFIQYTMFIIMSFLMLSFVFIMMPRASVSAQRIMEVLNTEILVTDPPQPKSLSSALPKHVGQIEFRDVSFRFAGAATDALSNISFTAKPGAVTAFVGSTGAGKTALVNLIPRFYDVTSGTVLVNDIDVRETTQRELRSGIGYVPQKALLFSGTIESNIKYVSAGMDDANMHNAAEIAQATEFILEKSEQYQEEIAQGGTNVSGGQRQRLSIARAVAANPKIYIFDDSFSALDFKTDALLRAALAERTQGATTLIVAQRIGTIKNADQIIVLDEGKMVGIGKHGQLLQTCEVYRQIAASQLSDEELARDLEEKEKEEVQARE